jgi:hypothetical protein
MGLRKWVRLLALTKNSSAMEEGGDGRRSCGARVGEKQKKRIGTMVFDRSMIFGGRANQFNKKLDENFGRNLSSFIIRYR